MEEVFLMSSKEIERSKVLAEALDKKITQPIAAKKLKLSVRHVRRLLFSLKTKGNQSILSKKRGVSSNRCLPKELKNNVLSLIQNYYPDFGPKLANEYLKEHHNIFISTETLRHWMIGTHLWIPKSKENKKLHSPRPRRGTFGELIQIDGSHHDWFEGRSPSCVLMVFIDDATSAITSLHFSKTESLEAYYRTLEKHLRNYGIPASFYGDRCSVLTPRNPKDSRDGTQFRQTLRELNCQLILALSPQAKGRVERANRTLQDRLVKEMRLKGISTIDEANVMLEEYRQRHNLLFSKKPNEQLDAHRSLEGICLESVLCTRETRTLDKNFIVQFKNNFYQISNQDEKIHLYNKGKIEIRVLLNGTFNASFKGKLVQMRLLNQLDTPIYDQKEVMAWKEKRYYSPSKTHPYKKFYDNRQFNQERLRDVI